MSLKRELYLTDSLNIIFSLIESSRRAENGRTLKTSIGFQTKSEHR